jgi:hypothetical protein
MLILSNPVPAVVNPTPARLFAQTISRVLSAKLIHVSTRRHAQFAILTIAVGNGAIGYGCDTDPASTPTPVASSFNGIVATIRSTAGSGATGTAQTTATSLALGTPATVSAVIPAVIVCVIYGLWLFTGVIILVICCQRHRRLMEAWDQQTRAAEIAHYQQAAAMATGVVPPPPVGEYYTNSQKGSQTNVLGPAPMPVSQQYSYIPPASSPPPMYYQAPGTPSQQYPSYQQPPQQMYREGPSPVGTPSPSNMQAVPVQHQMAPHQQSYQQNNVYEMAN